MCRHHPGGFASRCAPLRRLSALFYALFYALDDMPRRASPHSQHDTSGSFALFSSVSTNNYFAVFITVCVEVHAHQREGPCAVAVPGARLRGAARCRSLGRAIVC